MPGEEEENKKKRWNLYIPNIWEMYLRPFSRPFILVLLLLLFADIVVEANPLFLSSFSNGGMYKYNQSSFKSEPEINK